MSQFTLSLEWCGALLGEIVIHDNDIHWQIDNRAKKRKEKQINTNNTRSHKDLTFKNSTFFDNTKIQRVDR